MNAEARKWLGRWGWMMFGAFAGGFMGELLRHIGVFLNMVVFKQSRANACWTAEQVDENFFATL